MKSKAGRLGIFDSVDGVMAVVGSVVGAEDPFDMTDAELEEATKLLRKQREILRFYWTDQTSVEQALASGEMVASYAWNSAIVELKKQGVNVVYMNPKEGIWTWVCGLTLLVDGPGDQNKAYEFIDAWLAPASGKNLIEMYGYGHSNAKSFELVDPAVLDNLGITDPDTMMANSRFFGEIKPECARSTSSCSTRSRPVSRNSARRTRDRRHIRDIRARVVPCWSLFESRRRLPSHGSASARYMSTECAPDRGRPATAIGRREASKKTLTEQSCGRSEGCRLKGMRLLIANRPCGIVPRHEESAPWKASKSGLRRRS